MSSDKKFVLVVGLIVLFVGYAVWDGYHYFNNTTSYEIEVTQVVNNHQYNYTILYDHGGSAIYIKGINLGFEAGHTYRIVVKNNFLYSALLELEEI